MNKLKFEDAVKAIKDAGLAPEVTDETENEYGSIRYKVYNTDKELYIEFLCFMRSKEQLFRWKSV